jgi:RNA polymerase sigma factor (TIGR02999 family)
MADAREDITRVIETIKAEGAPADELVGMVYEHLHAIAQNRMRGEREGHTLQATALVNEACMKLLGDDGRSFADRRHFFGAAAEAMRRILIDHARMRGSAKRGGGNRRVPMSVVDLAEEADLESVLALDEALRALEREDETAAEVVRLRFFSGLSVGEVAETMGISERSVAREWAFARATLFRTLGGEDARGGTDGS